MNINFNTDTVTGTIPIANVPLGTTANQVAVGNDPRFRTPVAAVPSLGKEVWIAPDRNDGNAGDGTLSNPFDGSQGKLDALLNSLPDFTTIHLLPGLFHTKGSVANGNVAKQHIIRGAGRENTTILLDAVPANQGYSYVTFFGTQSGTLGYVEHHDLTLDGNIASQPLGVIVQHSMVFNGGGFYNLHVRNWGNANGNASASPSRSAEGFGINIGMADLGNHHAEVTIRDCVIDVAPYGGGSYLGVNSQGADLSTDYSATALIEGNVVNADPASAGIAVAGCLTGLRVVNNHVFRAARGFHQDTTGTPSSYAIIAHNWFESCVEMAGLGSAGNSPINNYVIDSNNCTLIGPVQPIYGVGGTALFIDKAVSSVTISNNRVAFAASVPSSAQCTFLYLGGDNGDVNVVNNTATDAFNVPITVQPDSTNSSQPTRLVNCFGNRVASGSAIPGLEDRGVAPAFSGTVKADAYQNTLGYGVVTENVSVTNYIGHCRLRFDAALPTEYIFQSAKYLVRLHHQDGTDATAILSISKPYQGNVSVTAQRIDGAGQMVVTAINTTPSTATQDTIGGQTFSRVHPVVVVSLSKANTGTDYMTASVTPLGTVHNSGGDYTDPVKYQTAYHWSIEPEPDNGILAGTTPTNVNCGADPVFTGTVKADAYQNTLGYNIVTDSVSQTNYIGHCRLRFDAALPTSYIFQSPKYLVRLHHQDGTDATAILSISKPYGGDVAVTAQQIDGTGKMVVTATNTANSSYTSDTITSGTFPRVHPVVKVSLSKANTGVDYMTVSVVPLGTVYNSGGDSADPMNQTAYHWSIEPEDDSNIIAGTTPANVNRLLAANGDGSQLQNVSATRVSISTGSLPATGSAGQFWCDGHHLYSWLDKGTGTYAWRLLEN